MVNAPVLEAKQVTMAFNAGSPHEVVAFRDISFTLRQGEILAIVGPSGCGKSTLFNVIAGLLRPTSGSVSVDGTLVDGARGHIGYMLQKDLLLPWRSVLDNVTLGLEVRGTPPGEARDRAMALIRRYGLAGFESARPRALSGGMRQRVAFMRTLALDPDHEADAECRRKSRELDLWHDSVILQARTGLCDCAHILSHPPHVGRS